MRAWLPWVVVVVLTAASTVSVGYAVADEAVADVNNQLYEANKTLANTGVNMDQAAWIALDAEARFATRLAPKSSYYWDAVARVSYLPRSAGGLPVPPDFAAAFAANIKAVVAQPSSGYAWSGLAYASDHLLAQNQLPGGKNALEQAIRNAASLGAREPHVLRAVVDLGLANWPTLSAAAQQDVRLAVKHLAERNSDDVIAIAVRRGALATVCPEKRLSGYQGCLDLNRSADAENAAI